MRRCCFPKTAERSSSKQSKHVTGRAVSRKKGGALFLFVLFSETVNRDEEDKENMARYFMGDTRLAGLERIMMDPSRSPAVPTDTRRKIPQKKLPCDRPAKPLQRSKGGGV